MFDWMLVGSVSSKVMAQGKPPCNATLVAIGNELAEHSDQAADLSIGLMAAGLPLALSPPPAQDAGDALMGAGGVAGWASSGLELGSGVFQGLGGAGWENAQKGAALIALGIGFERGMNAFRFGSGGGHLSFKGRQFNSLLDKTIAVTGFLQDLAGYVADKLAPTTAKPCGGR